MQYYHNPSCSKSRAALELLKENKIEPKVHLYLEEKPGRPEIVQLLEKLKISPRDLIRKGEPEYARLDLENASHDTLIDSMASHSNLIERPIFVYGSRAVIGRPPEKVLELVKNLL